MLFVFFLILVGAGAVVRAGLDDVGGDFTGLVIDLEGQPIANAVVVIGDEQTKTSTDGRFRLAAAPRIGWVTVTHDGYVSRTRAAQPDDPVLVRLTPRNPDTIAIQFTGDVMFGRRFYDPNQDGNTSDGLLRPGDGEKQHQALMSDAQPLIENSDLTVVNLETPLMTDPYYDPTQPRPQQFHQTKEFAFASDPISAVALVAAGVDVVDLGNNHVFDGLDAGVVTTIEALDAAGLPHFGGGRNDDEAWLPAVVEVRGQTVAFLGCTSITGDYLQPLTYVANAVKGGAARCDDDAIREHVAAAKAKYGTVVFSVHGGSEYVREQTKNVERHSFAAREAGASIVVNHHPHVLGGFDWDGDSLVAWSMGNFLFDQTVWPTFYSAVLSVHLEAGHTIRAYAEPIVIAGYKPRGVVGELADFVAREAAGRVPGPYVIEDGAVEVDVGDSGRPQAQPMTLDGDPEGGSLFAMAPGNWISSVVDGGVTFGRNLLWPGTFENEHIGSDAKEPRLWGLIDGEPAQPAYWDLDGADKTITGDAAYRGEQGIRLHRSSENRDDLVLSPIHRLLVDPGVQVTLTGMVRADDTARIEAQLSWYADTMGPSVAQSVVRLTGSGDGEWISFRIDATVPPNVLALGLYIRLSPPETGSSNVDLDDIAIISWAPTGSHPSVLYDYAKATGVSHVVMENIALPGAEEWTLVASPRQLPDGVSSTMPVTAGAASPASPQAEADD